MTPIRKEVLFQGSVIGMVHLLPLPGAPDHPGMEPIVDAATRDAEALLAGGVDALLVENMHDFPCLREREMGPEVAAAMTRAAAEVRRVAGADVPLGVQVLFAANRTAIAVAKAADLDFIRAEGWTYGHLSDKGWVEASAGNVVRYRKNLEAEGVRILVDVKKKHAAHAATDDVSISEMAANLQFQKADAVIVTGATTGDAPDLEMLRATVEATRLPVIVGSGMTAANVAPYARLAQAFIVGSTLKEEGDWRKPVSTERVRKFVTALREAQPE